MAGARAAVASAVPGVAAPPPAGASQFSALNGGNDADAHRAEDSGGPGGAGSQPAAETGASEAPTAPPAGSAEARAAPTAADGIESGGRVQRMVRQVESRLPAPQGGLGSATTPSSDAARGLELSDLRTSAEHSPGYIGSGGGSGAPSATADQAARADAMTQAILSEGRAAATHATIYRRWRTNAHYGYRRAAERVEALEAKLSRQRAARDAAASRQETAAEADAAELTRLRDAEVAADERAVAARQRCDHLRAAAREHRERETQRQREVEGEDDALRMQLSQVRASLQELRAAKARAAEDSPLAQAHEEVARLTAEHEAAARDCNVSAAMWGPRGAASTHTHL